MHASVIGPSFAWLRVALDVTTRRVATDTPTKESLPLEAAPAGLGDTLRKQGFDRFTSVQEAVLKADATGRDLRITSQTGSGKTVALGLLLADEVAKAAQEKGAARGPATPVALMVAPTRELAGQLGREFQWLYKSLGARVLVVTGGTSVQDEQRALKQKPHVVIGTPGRLVDHLRSKSLNLESLRALALDEADEMLDMNFEEELNAIVDASRTDRRTHLVSATFPRAVARLANRYQKDALIIEGTALGKANTDIVHMIMRVYANERYDAAVNVILRYPDDKSLIFVRTRVDTTKLANFLTKRGLPSQALNGEMTQRERSATFSSFRDGSLRYLVATDVAARGLDVQDIARVIQVDLPENEEVLTHRSGRTGRAGRKGHNVLFVPPRGERRASMMLRSAKMSAIDVRVPTPAEVREAAEERLVETLRTDLQKDDAKKGRPHEVAKSLLEEHAPEDVVAWLLSKTDLLGLDGARDLRQVQGKRAEGNPRGSSDRRKRGPGRGRDVDFTTFQVSWGADGGADKRNLLAVVCRRGNVDSAQVGAMRINNKSATVQIASDVAAQFEKLAAKPDKRNPQVKFRRWLNDPGGLKKKTKGNRPPPKGRPKPGAKKGKKKKKKRPQS